MRAVVLGVNGVTGRAIAAELAAAGWDVLGSGRDEQRFPRTSRLLGVEFVRADRTVSQDLDLVLGPGADVVVDCVAYTAQHARQLLRHRASFGSAVVLSSKAVYVDHAGRHSNSDEPPRFEEPVREEQPVLAPDYSGDFNSRAGYGANKVAMEETLMESGAHVSILRPSRVHGQGASPPREWFVVRRLLEGRRRIPLAHLGRTGNHPTAAVNLARLVRACAEQPGARILNAADPGRPTAAEMVEAIAAACARPVDVVGLPEEAPEQLGWTPWGTWPPFFLDTTAAAALGCTPVGTYAATVLEEVQQLVAMNDAERARLDRDPYFAGRFDYSLDDTALGTSSLR